MGRKGTQDRGRRDVRLGTRGRGIGDVMSGTRGREDGKADTMGNLAMFPQFACNIVAVSTYLQFFLPSLVPRIKIIISSST